MRNIVTLFASVLILAACSSPKYTYYFDRYDYNSGKKPNKTDRVEGTAVAEAETSIPALQVPASEVVESPLVLAPESVATMRADNSAAAVPLPVTLGSTLNLDKKYSEMSRSERKDFRKALKSEIRKLSKVQGPEGSSVAATKVMDNDLKMAIIFAAVALTLSFFGGVNSVFWILSVVSIVIAVVFFIKWLAKQ